MRKETDQFISSTILEGMTSIRALLHAREAGINDRQISKIYFDRKCLKKIGKNIGYLKAVQSQHEYELIESDAAKIDSLAIGNTHGGLVAICTDRTLTPLFEVSELPQSGFYAMIEGIEDPYNFGYALRSLMACGVTGIVLNERNWYTAAGVIARASAGASELLPVYVAKSEEAVEFFKSQGYLTVAADLRTEHSLGSTPLPHPLLLVVGGEKRGISASVLNSVDLKVKIPYATHFPASLSAASAVTMFAYEIMRQNIKE